MCVCVYFNLIHRINSIARHIIPIAENMSINKFSIGRSN